MKRIFIVGTSGCGKTTLANNLGSILNIPSIDVDDHYWLPGWQQRDEKEFESIITKLAKTDSWVISGNSSKAIIFERCDTIIWLDYSIWRCLYWGLRRSIRRMMSSETCCGGNYETLGLLFSKSSIFVWIITSFRKRKSKYTQLFSHQQNGRSYLRFTSPNEVASWIKEMKRN